MSDTAKRVAGTYIADETTAKPPLMAWLQEQCRSGSLSVYIKKFTEAQEERLDPALVIVESVNENGVACRIPCAVADHEDTRTFRLDVRFTLDPVSGQALRAV
jgi:hypothetical protein